MFGARLAERARGQGAAVPRRRARCARSSGADGGIPVDRIVIEPLVAARVGYAAGDVAAARRELQRAMTRVPASSARPASLEGAGSALGAARSAAGSGEDAERAGAREPRHVRRGAARRRPSPAPSRGAATCARSTPRSTRCVAPAARARGAGRERLDPPRDDVVAARRRARSPRTFGRRATSPGAPRPGRRSRPQRSSRARQGVLAGEAVRARGVPRRGPRARRRLRAPRRRPALAGRGRRDGAPAGCARSSPRSARRSTSSVTCAASRRRPERSSTRSSVGQPRRVASSTPARRRPGCGRSRRPPFARAAGSNHRSSLSESVLLKDNHLGVLGDRRGRGPCAGCLARHAVQVECDTLAQVEAAVDAGADAVLLDNMSPELGRDLRRPRACAGRDVCIEASGRDHDRERARTTPPPASTRMSSGALTHTSGASTSGSTCTEG